MALSEQNRGMLMKLVEMTEVEPAREFATHVFDNIDAQEKGTMLSMGTGANPFFVPRLNESVEPTRLFTLDAWRKSLAMARTVAANQRSTRILLSAAPKTGSTFIAVALAKALGLTRANLMIYSSQTYSHAALGDGMRDHHVDELSLISSCMAPAGFVSHHHMICTPYLAKQLALYNVVPILTKRNIFDAFVSLEEFILQAFAGHDPDPFWKTGVPDFWPRLDYEDRIDFLLDRWLHWYMVYYSTWMRCEAAGIVNPLWVRYETDMLGDKMVLAQRMCERLGRPEGDIPVLAEALAAKGSGSMNFNKGVAGRGEKITGRNRDRIVSYLRKYAEHGDFSEILDG